MHINLWPEIEQYLQAKVGTGFYSNATEVVRDAIRRMWMEDENLEKLCRVSCMGVWTSGSIFEIF